MPPLRSTACTKVTDRRPRLAVILNDTRVDRHHGCDRVMRTLESHLRRIGCRILATAPAHTDWRERSDVMAALEQAHLIVVNGEGTIHHDRPAGLTLLQAAQYGAARGIPTVLLNAAWEANGPTAVSRIREFTLVAVRDSLSLLELNHVGVRCTMVPDLSLYEAYVVRGERSGIGFTDSVDRNATVVLEQARRACGGGPVPVQHSDPGAAGAWRFFRSYVGAGDFKRPRFLLAMLGVRARHFRHQVQSDGSLLDVLASLELLVSGRYHACTLSLLAGTPFVAASTNTAKIRALIADAGLSGWRAETALTPSTIAEARRVGWERHEPAAITSFLADSRARTDTLFAEIERLL